MWQEGLVVLIVLVAVGFVVRHFRKSTSGPCGSGCSCSGGPAGRLQGPPLPMNKNEVH
jgi:hypothetical protein